MNSSKLKLTAGYLIAFILLGIEFNSCKGKQETAMSEEYTCPMHPKVIRDKPGSCPICKMDLAKREKSKSSSQLQDLEFNQFVDVKTVAMKRSTAITPLKSQGAITYDPHLATVVSSRIAGRIEKLYVKYLSQPVVQGQKLFEVYSTELATAQRELIYLTRNDASNGDLIQSAKEKLNLLGVDKIQIEEIVKSGKEKTSFAIFSPLSGYFVSSKENFSNETEINVREGNYIEASEAVMKIVSDVQVWAEFNIKQKETLSMKQGLPLTIKTSQGKMKTVVNFIQPFFKDGEEFLKVRSYLPNSNHKFKIGELIEAEFTISDRENNWLPLSSIVDLGTRKIVYVKNGNQFETREIQTGIVDRDWVEILTGLSPSDQIASSASYITDSEGFIKVNQ